MTPSRLQVVVYTRQDCHLCEQAESLLRQFGLQPQLIDVDADPALRQQFDHCVPVVVIDGVERFRGIVNPVLLARLLRASKGTAT